MLWRLDRLNMIDSLQYFFIIWVFECFWVFRFTSVIFQRTLSFYHKFVQKYPLLYSHDVTHTLQFQCFKSITLNRYTQRNTNVLTCCLHEARIYSAFHDTKRQHTGRLQPYWLFVENVNSCALRNRCGFKHNTHKCGRCVGFQGLLLLVAKKTYRGYIQSWSCESSANYRLRRYYSDCTQMWLRGTCDVAIKMDGGWELWNVILPTHRQIRGKRG